MIRAHPRAEARSLRRRTAAVLALLAGLLLVPAAGPAAVNKIVLRVNDEIATLYQFEQRRRTRIADIQRADLSPERRQRLLADVGADTLREMYEELLVLSRAEQLDVRISDREVEASVAQTRERLGIETEEEFRDALAAAGMTVEELADQMRRNLMIREVMGREVQPRVQLEEEDLRRYYRDNPGEFSRPRRLRVREVVVLEEAADPAEGAALAAEVRAALLAGEEGAPRLAELADRGQTSGTIELGWVQRGDLGTELEEAIWGLEPGAVSEPIEARGGLHVIQILDEEEARLEPFADVQEAIRSKLSAGRFEEEMSRYLAELEESAFLIQDPPPEAAGFRVAAGRDELDDIGLMPQRSVPRQPAAEDETAPADGATPEETPETAPEGGGDGASAGPEADPGPSPAAPPGRP